MNDIQSENNIVNESESIDTKMIPTLFIVHTGKKSYYYTNEEFAKKNLFDVTMKYYAGNSDDDNPPYFEAFGKGKWANLQLLYKLSLDIDNLCKLSITEKCTILNKIGNIEKNKKFED